MTIMRNRLTAKCKCKLEERYGSTTTCAKTVVHDFNIGIPATKLGIDNDETDSPICDNAEKN